MGCRMQRPAAVVLMFGILVGVQPRILDAADRREIASRIRFFESQIRPLLLAKCVGCHGSKKQAGGLRLDSRTNLIKGGESGPAIVVGRPDASRLMAAVRESDPELRMPRNGKLTARQVEQLGRWIKSGAVFPVQAGRDRILRDPNHWSFHSLRSPTLPGVKNRNWLRTPIDRFILARLDAEGIAPAADVDRRAWLRRVTFDLVGLPPSPEQLAAFLGDQTPGARSRVVERLLASPRYGERWGRHWLDVARYADSNGFDENVAHGRAWRYRDYVVESFNSDKPFDRFVTEQLAGDLMAWEGQRQRNEHLTATGFLSIGPKVLAETDQAKMRMDIIDEQIDTVGRALMGLTLGCARCHDHKFDPIATSEYYALAGIFKSTLTMRKYTKVAEWHEHLLPSPEATAMKQVYDQKVAAAKRDVEQAKASAREAVRKRLDQNRSGDKSDKELEKRFSPEEMARIKKLADVVAALKKAGPNLPAAMGVTEDKITDVKVHLRGDPQTLGDVVRRGVPAVLRGPPAPRIAEKTSGRLALARWLTDPRHPLTARVMVNRVWRWHFGRGLVVSTDNFGLLGERPTHPGLLDWLSVRLIRDGWSIKSLHRLIVLSRTYGLSSHANAVTVQQDPDNRWLGRGRVRRIEAEAIRDALLAVGGQLDGTMTGSLLKLKNRAYFFDHTSKDLTTYDSRRRSIYLPVVRNHVYDMFQLLDFPDPAVTTGDRTSTVVASQALMMLNSKVVMAAADGLARRLQSEADGIDGRISRMYLVVYGRPPTAGERQADRRLLAELADGNGTPSRGGSVNEAELPLAAWAGLCHVVLASNEFMYLR